MDHCKSYLEIDEHNEGLSVLSQGLILNKSFSYGSSSTRKNHYSRDEDLEIVIPSPKHVMEDRSRHNDENLQPMKGFIFMFLSVLGMTFYHLFAKLATFRNPSLTNNDLVLFVGVCNFSIFLGISIKDRVNLNPLNFKPYLLPFCLSLLCALGINNLMLLGVSLIPIGKAVLIFDINPILCIILAGLILKEKIERVYIFSACGSLIGIYLLTLNSEPNNSNSSPFLGTIIVICAAVCQGLVFITVRILGAARMHYAVRPCFAGATLILYSVIIQGGVRSYSFEDAAIMFLSGLSCAVCLGFQTAAFRYQLASKLAPMIYIENIFTILADVVIFGYQFGITDFCGICIIFVFILLPFGKGLRK